MAQQMKTGFAKCNQHYDVTEENRKSQNNPISTITTAKSCMGNLRPAGQIRPAKASHPARQ